MNGNGIVFAALVLSILFLVTSAGRHILTKADTK